MNKTKFLSFKAKKMKNSNLIQSFLKRRKEKIQQF